MATPPDRRRAERHYHRSQRNCRRRLRRAWGALRSWKHGAHYDAVNYLLRRWDIVVYSTASFGKMAADLGRPFGSKTARAAYHWSHYTFNQRLVSKAVGMPGKWVVPVEGNGTTGTCGLCGTWNPNVGAAKTYTCIAPGCGVRIDRDLNGARNNLLSALVAL